MVLDEQLLTFKAKIDRCVSKSCVAKARKEARLRHISHSTCIHKIIPPSVESHPKALQGRCSAPASALRHWLHGCEVLGINGKYY